MMTYPAARLALAGVLLAAVASASAQEASPAQPAPAPAAASTPLAPPASATAATTVTGATTPSVSAPAAPKKPRPMSEEVAAIMSSGMPKYNPPKPQEKAPEPVAEVDPKNDIPRLPQFIVRGNRTPVFKNFQERDLHDAKGLSDIEMKRNPGLNLPLIGFLNRPIALQMYRDKERLNDIDELRKAASDADAAGDSAGADYIRRTGAETFARRSSGGMLENQSP